MALSAKSSGRESIKSATVTVRVRRVAGKTGADAFYACAHSGKRSPSWKRSYGLSCAHGKNPREALAKSLTMFAAGVGKRSGAFAGLKKRSK